MWLKLNDPNGRRYLVNADQIQFMRLARDNSNNTYIGFMTTGENDNSIIVIESLDEIARLLDEG